MVNDAQIVTQYLEPLFPTYLDELRQLCAIECPTGAKTGVDAAGAWVQRWVRQRGWDLQLYPDDQVGAGLVATIHGTGTLRVMLVAHLDTVYPVGVAAARPMRIEGDTLLAPGSADNKSGLLSGLYAMAALEALGRLPFAAVSIVCGGDEETDARASGAMLRQLAPNYDLALVLEAGRENGDIVSARKGNGIFTLEAHGRAAHAGVEPEKGANAILSLARHIIALHALNGTRPGLTVNVGVIHGGSVPNAVPDTARAEVDVRISRPEDRRPVEDAIRAIAAAHDPSGVTTTVGGDGWRYPPMARTPAISALVELARACGAELGLQINDASTGGVSYANILAGAGLPILDGLGPVGGLDHSPNEYIRMSSIVPRTALLALLLLRWAEHAILR